MISDILPVFDNHLDPLSILPCTPGSHVNRWVRPVVHSTLNSHTGPAVISNKAFQAKSSTIMGKPTEGHYHNK